MPLPADMNQHAFFGTDGIRAHQDAIVFKKNFLNQLVYVLCEVLRIDGKVLMALDTRASGAQIQADLMKGFLTFDIPCMSLGVLPTAALGYCVSQDKDAALGVMITASHNPYFDNGLKFFNADGQKLLGDQVQKIEDALHHLKDAQLPSGKHQGVSSSHLYSAGPNDAPYVAVLTQEAKNIDLSALKIVIDCANGAASFLAAGVFEATGANIVLHANQPNGTNINQGCGSMHPQPLIRKVLDIQADLGIVFDGDADRLLLINQEGQLLDGNDLLVMMAQPYIQNGMLDQNVGVVGSALFNQGIEDYFRSQNVNFFRSGVGDIEVFKALQKHKWFLGAEPCGHVINLKTGFKTGDGLLNALLILKQVAAQADFFEACASLYSKYPEHAFNVPLNDLSFASNSAKIQNFVQEKTALYAELGVRLLVRLSGTEPVIRVRLEGRDAAQILSLADSIKYFFRTLSD